MRLENWSTCGYNQLQGEVFGNPKFPDGQLIITSAVKAIDGEIVISSSGSHYELGTVDPKYEAAFPEARYRFFLSRGFDIFKRKIVEK